MKNRKIWAAVLALCLMLAGCTAGTGGESAGEQEGQSASAAESQTGSEAEAPSEPETPALPELPEGPVTAADAEELSGYLELAMQRAEQPPAVEAVFLDSEADPEMTVRNLYYALLSEHPECKCAYDLAMERTGDGLYRITFSYMPYRTGDYPADFAGEEAGSFGELIALAQEHLDQAEIPVRITDPSLTVDDLNRALQQVGGGYLLCQLSRDGTAITVTPQNGLTHQAALDRLAEIETLAQQIVEECVTDSMTLPEQAEALYTRLTDRVAYDFRYYTDPASMPYESTTAYGALKDDLAICGGYAQALQALYEQVGIPCLTVSGQWNGENHMWNLVWLDGEWRYCDATSDRGRSEFGFGCYRVTAENLWGHTWDQDWVARLTSGLEV